MRREELGAYLESLLEVARYKDYCPNGLQVEGRDEVRKLVCGVTASQDLLEAAAARGADAILVHHGWFWRGEDGRVTGIRRRRLGTLLAHDISLFGYHLPLDGHGELGNNAQLALRMGWTVDGRFADQDIAFLGRPAEPLAAADLAAALSRTLGRPAQLVGDGRRRVRRLAWCSGGAQGYFEQAIAQGADMFVSGEISEQTYHLARESGVPYVAAGHHATERYGVQALAEHLAARFGLDCEYVELDNPV
ncbi:Nif3-like dinuclear metal center hexameric protein [Denitratisoma sp. DHT3]|uniref:Nif3-like dinuclear metal center hexameric protein n=1 Tax=Denitratisoma sp. DHT3 TaxID=1981880 RepID=UPI0011986B72|nr:Nif3-like dinuclear metal center hexameric protein [Denitratisoma sp. DHT3]QDX79966.1 Nif3-like dinuclear metal center hexameric protein [Denitratisoma sp. DHT3]